MEVFHEPQCNSQKSGQTMYCQFLCAATQPATTAHSKKKMCCLLLKLKLCITSMHLSQLNLMCRGLPRAPASFSKKDERRPYTYNLIHLVERAGLGCWRMCVDVRVDVCFRRYARTVAVSRTAGTAAGPRCVSRFSIGRACSSFYSQVAVIQIF